MNIINEAVKGLIVRDTLAQALLYTELYWPRELYHEEKSWRASHHRPEISGFTTKATIKNFEQGESCPRAVFRKNKLFPYSF